MNPSTDHVFQKWPTGRAFSVIWVSLYAICTPLTPKSFISFAHSSCVLGYSLNLKSVDFAISIKAFFKNQLTIPGLAPQHEIAVVLCFFMSNS